MITGKAFRFRKVISPAPLLFLLLFLTAPAIYAQADGDLDRLQGRLDAVRELSQECVETECPDADREAMQKLLNDLEDAQLFARLSAFWITQLPRYESSAELKQKVAKLRNVHDAIRSLIFKSSDGNSLMYCVVKLNEARGEDLSKALIDFNRNTGKESLPASSWETVQMTGNSLSLDTTDSPELAPEAVKALEPMIGKVVEGLSVPELGATGSRIEPARDRVEPGSQIEINYSLSPCVRLPKFVLIGEGDASSGRLMPSAIIASRDVRNESVGTVYLKAPERGGTYEIRVFDRYTDSLLDVSAKVSVLTFRSSEFPGVYQIKQSSSNSDIGSHIAIAIDDSGNYFWGSVFQSPVSEEWQFSQRAFVTDPSTQAYVDKANVSGTRMTMIRTAAECDGSAKKIPVVSELYLQSAGTSLVSRHQAWDCSSGEPVVDPESWEFEFQAERVSGIPPSLPGSGRDRIATGAQASRKQ